MPSRDAVWDAVCDVFGVDQAELSRNERGKLNAAVKQLKEVGATAEDVKRRAHRYREMYPDWAYTPLAVLNRWSQLKPRPTVSQERPTVSQETCPDNREEEEPVSIAEYLEAHPEAEGPLRYAQAALRRSRRPRWPTDPGVAR